MENKNENQKWISKMDFLNENQKWNPIWKTDL